jgi:hypothetical protein
VVGSRNVRSASVTWAARAAGSSAGDSDVVVVGTVVVGVGVVFTAVVVAPPPLLTAPLLVSSLDPPQPATSNATKMGASRRTT